jgi:acetyl esterase
MLKLTRYFTVLLLLIPFCGSAFADHPVKHNVGIVWASPKDFKLTLDIHVPQTESTKPKPVLVIFHGGGFLLNSKSIMTDLATTIASRTDIITVNVNYRLLSDLNNTTKINELVEDAMGSVLWVKDNIKQYGGDPTKVAVTGDSAGGHLASMVTLAGRNLDSDGFAKKPLGFKPTYLPEGMTAEQVARKDGLKVQATILSYTAFSLVGMVENGFEKDSPIWKWAHAKARGVFGDEINLKDNRDYYLAMSPDQYLIDAKKYKLPPQFVHVGDQDQATKPEFSEKYVEQMKGLGQSVRLKIYPGKKHGFLDSGCNDYNQGCFDDLSKPTVDDMIAFLNEVFGL